MASDATAIIGGEEVDAPSHPVYNPATLTEIVGRSARSGPELVDKAVRSAASAGPGWAEIGVKERKRLLAEAVTAATTDFDERARLLTREQGKALWESTVDLAGAPYLLHVNRKLVERAAAEDIVDDHRGRFITRRKPAGVVGVIVPWNYPVVLAFNGIAPALAAGNTVVVKPSELAPLALTRTIAAIAAVLPPGVLNVVPGFGDEAGAALVSHPLVRRVLFTGGTASGRAVMQAAAENITGVGLELGGNDPALVLESAVVDDTLAAALRHSAFSCSGQICFAIKRIYVHRSRHDELVDALSSALDDVVVGDGLRPETTMGPLVSDTARRRVQSLVSDAEQLGAIVSPLGTKLDPAGWDDGHFMLPHLVTDIPHDSALVRAEQFGPVLPIVPFDTEAEAVAMANDSEYGLAASVWSTDDDHAFDVARTIDSGTVFINVHRAGASDHTTPFGGMKQSGIGRSNGWASVEELTELQMLIRRDDTADLPGPPTN